MQILRVRRGFSTNCSGANEYFPPDPVLAPPDEGDAGPSPWSPSPDAKVVFRWVTMMPDGGPPPMLRAALAASSGSSDGGVRGAGDAGEGPPARRETDAAVEGGRASVDDGRGERPAAPDQVGRSSGFGLVLFLVMLGALVVFGVERLLRRLGRKRGRGSREGR